MSGSCASNCFWRRLARKLRIAGGSSASRTVARRPTKKPVQDEQHDAEHGHRGDVDEDRLGRAERAGSACSSRFSTFSRKPWRSAKSSVISTARWKSAVCEKPPSSSSSSAVQPSVYGLSALSSDRLVLGHQRGDGVHAEGHRQEHRRRRRGSCPAPVLRKSGSGRPADHGGVERRAAPCDRTRHEGLRGRLAARRELDLGGALLGGRGVGHDVLVGRASTAPRRRRPSRPAWSVLADRLAAGPLDQLAEEPGVLLLERRRRRRRTGWRWTGRGRRGSAQRVVVEMSSKPSVTRTMFGCTRVAGLDERGPLLDAVEQRALLRRRSPRRRSRGARPSGRW